MCGRRHEKNKTGTEWKENCKAIIESLVLENDTSTIGSKTMSEKRTWLLWPNSTLKKEGFELLRDDEVGEIIQHALMLKNDNEGENEEEGKKDKVDEEEKSLLPVRFWNVNG